MQHDAFAGYHPALIFLFFIAAIALCVIVNNPFFMIPAIICAIAYYLCVNGPKGWKVVLGMIPLYIVVMCINPLFNTMGDTVLFVIPIFGGRPYTLEALAYGSCTAAMFISALLWFFSYNKVMTTDKFTFLFGGLAPALTLVFTMVLRLVPTYQRKASEITNARACIGHSIGEGSWSKKGKDGLAILSALISWALEGGIITADSMRSRGYGTGKRTSFARYKFTVRDGVVLALMIAFLVIALVSIFVSGAGSVNYYPTVVFPAVTPLGVAGLVAFIAFLATPTIIQIGEDISWRNSLSKI